MAQIHNFKHPFIIITHIKTFALVIYIIVWLVQPFALYLQLVHHSSISLTIEYAEFSPIYYLI